MRSLVSHTNVDFNHATIARLASAVIPIFSAQDLQMQKKRL